MFSVFGLFLHKQRAAHRTCLVHRFVPVRHVTIRVSATAIENSSALTLFLNYVFTTFRTFYTYCFYYRLSIFAFRISAARYKISIAPGFDYHRLSAQFAHLARRFVFNPDLFYCGIRFLKVFPERVIKLSDYILLRSEERR